jgi:transposase
VEYDPTRVCERLVGLGDVEVLGIDDETGEPLRVHIRKQTPRPACERCGGPLWSDGERPVELVDLPAFGRPSRLVWHKRRWRCTQHACEAGTVTEQDPEIAPPREKLTARAGRWATRQAGRARPVDEVAEELGRSWHRVMASVRCWGSALLEADTERISDVFALGLDETLMGRRGRFGTKAWSTSIVDVGRGQLLDIVAGRTAQAPTQWLMDRPQVWREQIRWAVLDLSGPYRVAFDTAIPDAAQVADPFHVVGLGNTALDEVRRRVQNQTLGHRGHKHDPLYRARKLLVSASENITDTGRVRLRGLLDAGDPYGEVRDAWHAKETLRSVYDITDTEVGAATVTQLADDLQDPGLPPEINRLGRTLWRWRTQISNWHAARVTNAATEAANNLIKRVKRAAFGFTNFANYRIRALLYADKPDWTLLDTLTPT